MAASPVVTGPIAADAISPAVVRQTMQQAAAFAFLHRLVARMRPAPAGGMP